MLNQFVLVGRVVDKTKLSEDENNKKAMGVTISVPRAFKNVSEEYDNDFIDITLYDSIAKGAENYLENGDLVGIRGRLARQKDEALYLVVEKLNFLSSGKNNHDKSL